MDITVTARETGERTLWVEALDGEHQPLARGRVRAMFSTLPGVSVLVELAMPCDLPEAFGAPCVRPETLIVDGICVDGACVESRCGDGIVELAGDEECDVTVSAQTGDTLYFIVIGPDSGVGYTLQVDCARE